MQSRSCLASSGTAGVHEAPALEHSGQASRRVTEHAALSGSRPRDGDSKANRDCTERSIKPRHRLTESNNYIHDYAKL
jgi:hypothetical protein